MQPERVYFTWPDSVFTYDCASCGACCRGLGIGLDAAGGQLARLVELYPELAGFVRRRGAAVTAFNPRGRCWFLAGDGLCRIERDHGRLAKPASCSLFPFNRVFRLGSTMVVDFNSVICPLASAGGGAVTHAAVLADIDQVADPAVIGTPLAADDAEREGLELVAREQAIATACFAAAAAADPTVEAGWAAQADPGGLGAAQAGIGSACATLLGEPWRGLTGVSLATALWLTPSLRFNELYGPRTYVARAELVGLLPRLWLAWLHFLAAGTALAGRDLTMQESTSIWAEQLPLCYLMARWHEKCVLAPGPVELPGAGVDPSGVVRSFGEAGLANRGKEATLGQLLTPLVAELVAVDRIAVARMIEPLYGQLRFGDWRPSAAPNRNLNKRKRRKRKR